MLRLRTSLRCYKCPGCQRILKACLSNRSDETDVTAALKQATSKIKRGKKNAKYVELIQVESQNGSKAVKRFAKIKHSSATNVLRKLGVKVNRKATAFSIDANEQTSFKDEEALIDDSTLLNPDVEDSLRYALGIGPSSNCDTLEEEFCNDVEEETQITSSNSTAFLSQKHFNLSNTSIEESAVANVKPRKSPWLPSLLAYVDVCVQNETYAAHNSVLHYHRMTNLAQNPKSVKIYNTVLHGWAKEMNYQRLDYLLTLMEQEGPCPTLQSYAAAIECTVRSKCGRRDIQKIIDRAEQRGFNFSNLFLQCKFVKDQREKVVEGLRSVLLDFKPKPAPLDTDYSCSLLEKLNSSPPPKSRSYSPMGEGLHVKELQDLAKLQLEIESQGVMKVKSVVKRSTNTKTSSHWRQILKDCEHDWRKSVTKAFENNLRVLKIELRKKPSRCHNLYPFLSAMPSSIYIDYSMQEIDTLARFSQGFSPSLSILQHVLGIKLMERYFLETKKKNGILDKVKKLYNEFCVYYCTPELTSKYTPRQYWEILLQVHCNGADIDYPDVIWPQNMVSSVGQFLYNILLNSVRIDNNIVKHNSKKKNLNPAFYTVYRKHEVVKVFEEIKANPVLVKLYKLADCDTLTFDVSVLPMLSPPRPWSSIYSGGFLIAPTTFVRLPAQSAQSKQLLENTARKNLFPVFDSLNQLGECPWKINERILDIVIEIFNNKGSNELEIPQPPSECPQPEYEGQKLKSKLQKRAEYNQRKAEMYSLWCDMLYKLSIANQLRKTVLWFPHNIDFRGRTYPYPPHFNHLGSDVCRALLLFAKGEKIGDKGLQWLKIHLINLTGTKKRSSLDDRLKYCDEILNLIMDSADNPLKGEKWWIKSDEPWQTLACCMELTSALRTGSPHDYISHFPVHQDGSCNGLQHYAALGRDKEGADQVNLYPRDVPQDVYSRVAELVEQERATDAASGSEIAKALEGFVSRKVVKQPVMTTVYGVTRFGARHQILKRLKEIPDFPMNFQWKASSYLVTKTFSALQQMFSATKRIQDWLTESATMISANCCQPVKWVTPLGLPICQPYFKKKKNEKCISKKKNSVKNKEDVTHEIPNVRKQRNGFPPNYIHSLDSTHMMLTSMFCQRAGITFVSVHDCFWTHPSTVDIMNMICREQFVALHSEPLLPTLSDYMLKAQEGEKGNSDIQVKNVLSRVPKKGTFDLLHVLKSTYFFS